MIIHGSITIVFCLGIAGLVHGSTKQARTYYGACLPRVSLTWIGDDKIGFPVGDANKPEDSTA